MSHTDRTFAEDNRKLKRFIKRMRNFEGVTFDPGWGRVPIYLVYLYGDQIARISYNRALIYKPPIEMSATPSAFVNIDIATSIIGIDARQTKLASDYLEMLVENYDPL